MIESRILTMAILFGAIFGSGFWLSRTGKPHNALMLNLHKLISLAAVVLLFLTVSQVWRAEPEVSGLLAASAAVGVFFLATIVTGGLVSAMQSPPPVVSALHKYLPYATLLATAAVLFLLFAVGRQVVL